MISQRPLTWLGIAALIGSGVLSALLEMFLIPLYAGATLVPIAVVLAVVGNVVLLHLGRELSPNNGWRLSPFVAWFVAIVVFGLTTRPEGDVVVPGGGGGLPWVGYGVVFGGLIAGAVAAVFFSPPPRQRRPLPDQPVKG